MMSSRFVFIALLAIAPGQLWSQMIAAARPLGPVVRVSAPGLLSSVSSVRPLPDGRVIVNDVRRGRVVLMDSTFIGVTVIADSTNTAPGPLGIRTLGIIAFRGDSTIIVDPAALALLVVDADGKIARVIAMPRQSEAMYLIGGPFGTPTFDHGGRLLYRGMARAKMPQSPPSPGVPFQFPVEPDSAPLVRFDFSTRRLDTLGLLKVARVDTKMRQANSGAISIVMTINPVPVVDDWAMLSDGTVALVRGRDYHVEWLGLDSVSRSTPPVAFQWERLTDERRRTVLDSAERAVQIERERAAAMVGAVATGGSSPSRTTAAGGSMAPIIQLTPAAELPDYLPAFVSGAARGDLDGRLWVRTSVTVNGGAVYDVFERTGRLVDRVAVPRNRYIAGFAAGVVFMGVLDQDGARLELARIRQ